jgi:peroxiredoxin-like protein
MPEKIRYEYKTSLKWIEGKRGVLKSEGKPDIEVATPAEFGGPEGYWSPEALYTASAEVCNMTTFLAIIFRRGIELESYESETVGVLESTDEGPRMVSITMRPKVKVKNPEDAEKVAKLLERTHQHCLVSNSMTAEVHVEIESSD